MNFSFWEFLRIKSGNPKALVLNPNKVFYKKQRWVGRGRREFRIAAHLGCKLICPGKPSPPIRLVLFGPVSERQKPAGQGAALHRVAMKPKHRPAPPHLPRARLPHALHPFLKPPSPASGGGGYKGATCGGANHSPIHFPSTTVQTLGIRISSILCPPHCPRALCSIHGIKRVRIISFRVPSVLPSRQDWRFTQNVSIPFPTSLGTLRCALPDRAKKKAFGSQAPANHHPNPAYNEFRPCLPLHSLSDS